MDTLNQPTTAGLPSDATPSAPNRPLTYGERAVGLTFNPSGDTRVQSIKEHYAQIIDLILTVSDDGGDKVTEKMNGLTRLSARLRQLRCGQ